MNNKYIGVFDSGIGGLTVVKAILDILPNENIVYFGDTLHMPYGEKSPEDLRKLVLNNCKFLNSFDLKAIVIACGTAGACCMQDVIDHNDLPVFGVIDPASKLAAKTSKNKKIGVIATKAAINSNAYEKAIHKFDSSVNVISKATPLLASLVEEGRFTNDNIETKTVLKEYLQIMIDEHVDTLILGCTHYPLLSSMIKEILPDVNIISSSKCAADALKSALEANNLMSDTFIDQKYFVSSNPERFTELANIFMDKFNSNVSLKKLD